MTDQSPSYHYGVIARALRVIDEGGPALTLDDLAARMDMSPAHFQRTFSQWVGISPKRYQQYLTLDHARRMLAERFTTLETALATGLSGTGRLHDLFLTWEAMTPGDFAKGAAGLTIRWGWFDSPFGPAIVMGTGKGICGMGFAAEMGADGAFEDLLHRWPRAEFVEDPMALRPWVLAAFGGDGQATPLHLIGAPFQIKVWEALIRHPLRPCHHLWRHCRRHRPAPRRARGWHRRGAQPDQPADPLPPRPAPRWRARRLSLGAWGETRDPRA